MIEEPDGEWVKWEDVEERIREAYKEGYFTGQNNANFIDMTFSSNPSKIDNVKCNCEEKAKGKQGEYPNMIMESWWVCPAHGYKRR